MRSNKAWLEVSFGALLLGCSTAPGDKAKGASDGGGSTSNESKTSVVGSEPNAGTSVTSSVTLEASSTSATATPNDAGFDSSPTANPSEPFTDSREQTSRDASVEQHTTSDASEQQTMGSSDPGAPDVEGLVEVDGPFVVLRVVDSGEFDQTLYRVDVVEVDTGVVHHVTEGSGHFSHVEINPQRNLLFFDESDQTSAAQRTVMSITEQGFVPPRRPPGYTDDLIGSWTYLSWEWSSDGQVGAVTRNPLEGYVYLDFIDAHTGTLLGSTALNAVADKWGFGGHTMKYVIDSQGAQTYADITFGAAAPLQDGVWNVELPAGGDTLVGLDGTVFYFHPDEQGAPLLMKQTPGAQPVQLRFSSEFVINRLSAATSNGKWLIFGDSADATSHLFALPLEGGEPFALNGLQGNVAFPLETKNKEWMLLQAWQSEVDTLVALRTADLHIETLADNTAIGLDSGVQGNHLFFQPEAQALRYVGFEADSPIVVTIDETAEASVTCFNYRPSPPPAHRSVVRLDSETFLLVDLSAPAATIAARIEASSAGNLADCPTWSIDGKSFIYSEQVDNERRIFRVLWDENGVSTPEFVTQTSEEVLVIGVR